MYYIITMVFSIKNLLHTRYLIFILNATFIYYIKQSISNTIKYCCCSFNEDSFRGLSIDKSVLFAVNENDLTKVAISKHVKENCLEYLNGVPSSKSISFIINNTDFKNNDNKYNCIQECEETKKQINEDFIKITNNLKQEKINKLKSIKNIINKEIQEIKQSNSNCLYQGLSTYRNYNNLDILLPNNNINRNFARMNTGIVSDYAENMKIKTTIFRSKKIESFNKNNKLNNNTNKNSKFNIINNHLNNFKDENSYNCMVGLDENKVANNNAKVIVNKDVLNDLNKNNKNNKRLSSINNKLIISNNSLNKSGASSDIDFFSSKKNLNDKKLSQLNNIKISNLCLNDINTKSDLSTNGFKIISNRFTTSNKPNNNINKHLNLNLKNINKFNSNNNNNNNYHHSNINEKQNEVNRIEVEINILEKKYNPVDFILERFSIPDKLMIKLIDIFKNALQVAIHNYKVIKLDPLNKI